MCVEITASPGYLSALVQCPDENSRFSWQNHQIGFTEKTIILDTHLKCPDEIKDVEFEVHIAKI